MANVCFTLNRFLISFFHACSSAGAIVCVAYTLVRWGTESNCFPPMAHRWNNDTLFSLSDDSGLCESIYSILSVTAFLHVVMCIVYNCFWRKKWTALLNLFMTMVVAGAVVFVAAMFVMYHIVWCQSVKENTGSHGSCSWAVVLYDRAQKTRVLIPNINRLRIEVVALLVLVPVSIVNVLLYGVALGLPPPVADTRQSASSVPTPTIPKETTPLLSNMDDSINDYGN